ncbi:hypothetical protein PMIN02_003857 [Paraphaeosphaeria minitans]
MPFPCTRPSPCGHALALSRPQLSIHASPRLAATFAFLPSSTIPSLEAAIYHPLDHPIAASHNVFNFVTRRRLYRWSHPRFGTSMIYSELPDHGIPRWPANRTAFFCCLLPAFCCEMKRPSLLFSR